MKSDMVKALQIFTLLSLCATAQATQYIHELHTQVSVPQSQLPTTVIVSATTEKTSDRTLSVTITAEISETMCNANSNTASNSSNPTAMSCPDPLLNIAIWVSTNYGKTYNYCTNHTRGLWLTINIGKTVSFHEGALLGVPTGKAIINLDYVYEGSTTIHRNPQTQHNTSAASFMLGTSTTETTTLKSEGHGQPALCPGGLLGIMLLALLPTLLPK
ncbi:uncharacterized protein [Hyperolius riggenbachi]|uniref:uncharacterized protein n=1 Tax=Hyperolius riggenbachi TaxID=752182 RepID=UPI0035A3CE73